MNEKDKSKKKPTQKMKKRKFYGNQYTDSKKEKKIASDPVDLKINDASADKEDGKLQRPAMAGTIEMKPWGNFEGKEVKLFTLKNNNGQEVDVLNYGATIRAVRTPDKGGRISDVVLGFDDINGYLGKDNPYFGATVGRVANRIGKGKFKIDGVEFSVSKNIGENTLHGGFKGWNSMIWESVIRNDSLVMSLLSKDNDEGFPGDVIATTIFKFSDDGSLTIEMKACATKATPINLTNHSYFNLAGHDTNSAELYKHSIMVNADRWTVTDADSIPTGEIRPVENSIMDLRSPTVLGDVINQVPGGGYDYNFCLTDDFGKKPKTKERLVAKVVHPESGRVLETFSNQPGVQLYTSNFIPDKNTSGIVGKEGKTYFKHAALCLETQNYPDAVNHENFPDSILRPGDIYNHVVVYKFTVEK
ncbi:galactose mutarotase isoform X1 [Microplitis demolitor]|uniref:galactose mutarotase isoform X1 n=2 Tax=Microplitis demolitor TaxID=69319 RepID=UPI00235B6561|nr:galactose mutarotase isoform X1 [Microplitis demolitor]XP_053596267.1 galactose mutarotase isoform X1 [Microplitis demolitor]XP_053596275.1 galactose mutarotase isoform X1 [Microplitis demolitor]